MLITNDHPLVRHGLNELVETHDDIKVVGEAAGGEQSTQKTSELLPGVTFMDLLMPWPIAPRPRYMR